MTVLILTSKNHIYANYLLGSLLRAGLFDEHKVVVFEQDAVYPGKSMPQGLAKYWTESGPHYVVPQIVKQVLFLVLRGLLRMTNAVDSPYYPYYVNVHPAFTRELCNGINRDAVVTRIGQLQPDILMSLYSKEIISRRILRIPRLGCVNVHPAFLPEYRGVSPTFWCLTNGEDHAGATLHHLDSGIDTGQIISQVRRSTKGIRTEHALYMVLTRLASDLIRNFMEQSPAPKSSEHRAAGDAGKRNYHSLPSKEAVKKFRERGCKFFTLREMIFDAFTRKERKTVER